MSPALLQHPSSLKYNASNNNWTAQSQLWQMSRTAKSNKYPLLSKRLSRLNGQSKSFAKWKSKGQVKVSLQRKQSQKWRSQWKYKRQSRSKSRCLWRKQSRWKSKNPSILKRPSKCRSQWQQNGQERRSVHAAKAPRHDKSGLNQIQILQMITKVLAAFRYSQLAEGEFLKLAYSKLEELAVLAQQVNDEDIDVSSTNAILTVRRKNHTIVINTQTPNRQLWYSSTVSGPRRFNYEEGKWVNTASQDIEEVLSSDLRAMLLV